MGSVKLLWDGEGVPPPPWKYYGMEMGCGQTDTGENSILTILRMRAVISYPALCENSPGQSKHYPPPPPLPPEQNDFTRKSVCCRWLRLFIRVCPVPVYWNVNPTRSFFSFNIAQHGCWKITNQACKSECVASLTAVKDKLWQLIIHKYIY